MQYRLTYIATIRVHNNRLPPLKRKEDANNTETSNLDEVEQIDPSIRAAQPNQ